MQIIWHLRYTNLKHDVTRTSVGECRWLYLPKFWKCNYSKADKHKWVNWRSQLCI